MSQTNQHEELNTEDLQGLTEEQLEQRKGDMLKFYTESLTYLEAQYKYEELLMRIDEVRFKRTQIQMQYAMMMARDSENEEEELDTKKPSQTNAQAPTPESNQSTQRKGERRPLKRH